MICGICNNTHKPGTYIKTESYGYVAIECLINLAEKVIKIGKQLEDKEKEHK
jgi:hypothetical protein